MADGKVIIDTELDGSGAINSIPSISRKLESGFGAVVGSVAKIGTASIAAGATATAALTKLALDSYASYEQLIGGVETLFKDSAYIVEGYANNAYKTAGLSANAYMETVTSFSAALLQGLGGDTEKAAQYADRAIIDMSDNANKMGTSIDMIQHAYAGFAKQNFTMLDNLKLGYGGTKTEMQRLIKDASEMIDIQKELGITVDAESMSFDNIINAISVTQRSMGIMGTTAKEASSTVEGSINSMKGAWTNLVAGLGKDDADVDKLINDFVDSVETVGENVLPRLEIILNSIGNLIDKLLPKVIENIPSVITKIVPKLIGSGVDIVSAIIEGITDASPEIEEGISELLDYIGEFIFDELPKVIDTISDVISDFDLADNVDFKFIDNLADDIRNGLPTLISALGELVTDISVVILDSVPAILDVGVEIALALIDGFLSSVPDLLTYLPTIVDSLANALLDGIPLIMDAGVDLLTSLVNNLPDIIDTVVEVIPDIVSNLIDAILDHLPDIAEAGFELLSALVTNLPEILKELGKGVAKLIKNLVVTILDKVPDIAEAGFELLVSLFSNVGDLASDAGDAVNDIWEFIKEAFEGLFDDMASIGEYLIEGLWEGISGAGEWLGDKLDEFGEGVLSGVQDFFGIASPSKLMRDKVGRFIAEGIWVGFDMYNPMDKINTDLEYGMKNLDTSMTLNSASYAGVDYERIGEEVTNGFVNANVGVSVDGRQYGRLVRGYA